MPLYRISYISRAPESRGVMRDKFVASILTQARENNTRLGITGMLVYVDDYFLQTFEGSRGMVSGLLSRIMNDDRHRDVHVTEAKHIPSRLFGQKMTCFNILSDDIPMLLRYAVSTGFCPYELSPQSLEELFTDLALISKRDATIQAAKKKKQAA